MFICFNCGTKCDIITSNKGRKILYCPTCKIWIKDDSQYFVKSENKKKETSEFDNDLVSEIKDKIKEFVEHNYRHPRYIYLGEDEIKELKSNFHAFEKEFEDYLILEVKIESHCEVGG
jgi:uncharacterized C2H2 Zn-finger protein